MKLRITPSRVQQILLASLLILLPLLAILQYRWIGEVSAAERQRLADSVNTAAIRFAEDFNTQLTRGIFTFQLRGLANVNDVDDLGERFAQRYSEWSASSSYPQLVKSVYLARRTGDGDVELLKPDPQAATLEAVNWPSELDTIHGYLQRRANGERGNGPARLQMRFGSGQEPVFVVPIVSNFTRPGQRGQQAPVQPTAQRWPPFRGGTFQTLGWTVIEFDRRYLLQEFVPSLINRYFQTDGSTNYRFAIVSHDGPAPAQLVYRSDSDLTLPDLEPSDVAVSLFAPESGRSRRPGQGGPARGQGGAYGAAGLAGPGLGGQPGALLTGSWQLIAKNRAGSLDRAVASLRWKNLGVSFGILLILGASIIMIVMLSARARTLAQLQMDFVARVSHELRTPLAIIRSAAYNVVNGIVSKEEDVREYASIVAAEGQRLSSMVDQILLFSRMEAGHAAYDLQPLDVGEIVEQSIRTMSASLNEASCRISRRIPENLPAVKADAGAITQCLQNLLSNAVKYGRNAEMAKIEVAAEANLEEHTVQIRVMDSGPGIDSSDLPQIFEPFFRGKNARSDIPGSGLGLNLVRRLMTGQGGRVTVESRTGEGTTFTLHLPEMMESSG